MSAERVSVPPIKRTSCDSALSLKDLMSLCIDRGVQAYLISCARADLCAMNTIDRGGGVKRKGGRKGWMNRRNSKRLPSSKLLSKTSKGSQWGGGRVSSHSPKSNPDCAHVQYTHWAPRVKWALMRSRYMSRYMLDKPQSHWVLKLK